MQDGELAPPAGGGLPHGRSGQPAQDLEPGPPELMPGRPQGPRRLHQVHARL